MTLYLADKSAIERRFRNETAARFFAAITQMGELATCEIVVLEVRFSARNRADFHRLDEELRKQTWITTDGAAMSRALDVQRLLAERGQHRLSIADLLIAATAELNGAIVLHYDHDFERIAAVTSRAVARDFSTASV